MKENADWTILNKWFGLPVVRRKPDALQMSERGKDSAAKRKVLKLLEQNPSIDVDPDRQGGWWVTCEAFNETNDPCDGAHWCNCWREVLETVEVYAVALQK